MNASKWVKCLLATLWDFLRDRRQAAWRGLPAAFAAAFCVGLCGLRRPLGVGLPDAARAHLEEPLVGRLEGPRRLAPAAAEQVGAQLPPAARRDLNGGAMRRKRRSWIRSRWAARWQCRRSAAVWLQGKASSSWRAASGLAATARSKQPDCGNPGYRFWHCHPSWSAPHSYGQLWRRRSGAEAARAWHLPSALRTEAHG